MKKFVLAGGLLAVLAAPAYAVETDVILRGNVGFSLSHYESDNLRIDTVKNNASRFGLFASAEESGIKAFLSYERGFDRYTAQNIGDYNATAFPAGPTEDQDYVREFFGGVATQYGTLAYGRMASAYRRAGEKLDPFYDTSVAGFSGRFAAEGANYGFSNLTNGFTNNSIEYTSPGFYGLTFNGGVYWNDNVEPNDKHDFGAGVRYNGIGVFEGDTFEVGVQYLDIRNTDVFGVDDRTTVGGSPGKSQNIRGTATYGNTDRWSVALSYESVDVDAENDTRGYGALTGTYKLTDKVRMAGGYGNLNNVNGNTKLLDGNGFTLGAFYEVFKNFDTYVAGRFVDYDTGPGTQDSTSIAIGASYTFEIDLQ